MTPTTLALAFLAGLLTTLSPCVLPVLPFVTASSLAKNRFGPLALALGLLVTFVLVTLAISSSGGLLGFTPAIVRRVSGGFLAVGGLLFLSARLTDRLATLLSGLTGRAASLSQRSFGGPAPHRVRLGSLWGTVFNDEPSRFLG